MDGESQIVVPNTAAADGTVGFKEESGAARLAWGAVGGCQARTGRVIYPTTLKIKVSLHPRSVNMVSVDTRDET